MAQVIRHPLTVSQIWKTARAQAPKIQLRDVWFILRQWQERGLILCLTPSLLSGRIYFWTDRGRAVAETAFGTNIAPVTPPLNWNSLGKVTRAQIRRTVLEAIGDPSLLRQGGRCVSEIRRQLLDKCPMELSRTIRAVKELSDFKLIRHSGCTIKPRRKLYELTPAGRRIVEILKRQNEPHPSVGNNPMEKPFD